ncbi:uncharacterized protein LOC119614277 [Lucilia sericata]|uniref:uncharacterized protein LOC119614277 n=1 Tax=Lucilia sericata TaxID=13632 RepID=UPI0018A837BD|nr:uncharacterized protein LOC119614277 [Lucilia sericata]
MARSMMVHAGVNEYLWAEAVNTAAYIRNRCPSRQLENKTPYEMWFGRKPNVDHLKTFGSYAEDNNNCEIPRKAEDYLTIYLCDGDSSAAVVDNDCQPSVQKSEDDENYDTADDDNESEDGNGAGQKTIGPGGLR